MNVLLHAVPNLIVFFFFNIPASITFFFSHFIDVFSSTVYFEHTTLLNDVAISLRVF